MKQTLQERSKEVFDLGLRLKKFTQAMDIIEKKSTFVQTEVSFKNEAFTTTVDAIIEKKLNNKVKKITKIMQKAQVNINNIDPMSKEELMELIAGAYIKKSSELNKRTELFLEFDDFVYGIIT